MSEPIEGRASRGVGRSRAPFVVSLSPSSEGMNMGVWIGFKHVNYVAEHAISAFLRDRCSGIRDLYWGEGLRLDPALSQMRYRNAVLIDDPLAIELYVERLAPSAFDLSVKLCAPRLFEEQTVMASGAYRMALMDQSGRAVDRLPERLRAAIGDGLVYGEESARFVPPPLEQVGRPDLSAEKAIGASQEELRDRLGISDPGVFVWARRLPYFYCHYYNLLGHSGYLRLLEEVVDEFFSHAQLPIDGLLPQRRWIPVVQNHSLEIVHSAMIGETMYTTFQVLEVIAGRLFRARVAFSVLRNGRRILTGVGEITHGFVAVEDPEWESRLVRLDREALARLERWTASKQRGEAGERRPNVGPA